MHTVLIVEDDPMVAAINQGYLERTSEFRLAGIAYNGEEARAFLASGGISLVLLDIGMPGTDGLSLLREIRDRHPDIDVIMITASAGSKDIQSALRMGVADYIVKPFTRERFQAALVTYAQRASLLKDGAKISQEVLDASVLNRPGSSSQLPKGVDKDTLRRIRDAISEPGREYKMGDLVLLTGLSRVSIKKYLDYLESVNRISRSLVYPPLGRPYSVFRWNASGTCAEEEE